MLWLVSDKWESIVNAEVNFPMHILPEVRAGRVPQGSQGLMAVIQDGDQTEKD